MAGQRRHIGVRPDAPQLRNIFGEGFEFPTGAGEQRVEIHALDYRQILEHRVPLRCRAGRDAESAISHHRRGHAEGRRRRQGAVPGDLRVVVGMDIDDARHQREAVRIDDLARTPGRPAHFGDATVVNCHVGGDWCGAAAVENGGTPNEQIEHARTLSQVTARFRRSHGRPSAGWFH